ncbi:MAG: RNA methyltransferase [Chitinophagales bacterium]|nr:RNA methyltransferase [Chitinophagales bacterium]
MRKLLNEELPRLTKEEFKEHPKTPVVIVLDNIRSHLNVGSVFRTADAFLIEAIYLCGITGIPPHRDIHKTALGATDTVSWKHFETTSEAIASLKSSGYKVIALEQAENATMLNDFKPTREEKYAIVFGNEVDGVEQEIVNQADLVIEIPQFGMKHSLNIAVSAGVVIWDFFFKLNK